VAGTGAGDVTTDGASTGAGDVTDGAGWVVPGTAAALDATDGADGASIGLFWSKTNKIKFIKFAANISFFFIALLREQGTISAC
jgi:hypothetical protein